MMATLAFFLRRASDAPIRVPGKGRSGERRVLRHRLRWQRMPLQVVRSSDHVVQRSTV